MSKKRIIERYFLRQKYSRGKLMMLIKRKSKENQKMIALRVLTIALTNVWNKFRNLVLKKLPMQIKLLL